MQHGAVGYLITDWGDGGHHQYYPVSWPGYAAGAALSWSFQANAGKDIADALDLFVFNDEAGVLGGLLLAAGRVQDLIPITRGNSSLFNHWLFGSRDRWEQMGIASVPRDTLRQCLRLLDGLSAKVDRARPRSEDGEVLKAEVRNGIAMAGVAVQRALVSTGEQMDMAQLRHSLHHIIATHEDLWLARNRRGGLRESSTRLRDVLATLC
jgi:hypothetical protein